MERERLRSAKAYSFIFGGAGFGSKTMTTNELRVLRDAGKRTR